MRSGIRLLGALAVTTLLLTAPAGHAQQKAATLQVRVNVVRSCAVQSVDAERDAASVTVTCSGRHPGVVADGPGIPSGARVLPVPAKQRTVVTGPPPPAITDSTLPRAERAPAPLRRDRQLITINF
jgi:hypothetical protein